MKQIRYAGKFLFVALLLICNSSIQAQAISLSTNNFDKKYYEERIIGDFQIINKHDKKTENKVVVINSTDKLPDTITITSGKEKKLKKIINDNYIQEYSSKEIAILERIVEAEAEGEDMIGKILVVNVILNRVQDDEFPDTIRKVVFQEKQFEPIRSGRYYDVTVSEETKEAVAHVIERGVDYSRGALFFHGRYFKGWSCYTKLFTYEGHTFYAK